METVFLILILEGSTVAYVGYRVVPHTVCIYKESGTEKKHTYYIPSALYRCPKWLRLNKNA
tara:strand:- start:1327 stop:1509 length:183 start_codon:yes stop_codon:yes gene_type:complete